MKTVVKIKDFISLRIKLDKAIAIEEKRLGRKLTGWEIFYLKIDDCP